MSSSPKHLVFALALALSVGPSCYVKGPDGVPFEHRHEVSFEGWGKEAEPADASEVEIHEKREEIPDAFYYDEHSSTLERRFIAAPGYPSKERPHRVLGKIKLIEDADVSFFDREELRAGFSNESLRRVRHKIVSTEAARHGANAVFLLSSGLTQMVRMTRKSYTYYAVDLSPDPPKYPEVSDLLEQLKLAKDGYREVKRFTAKLEDLPTRAPESIPLKRGHCYMLAIAFQGPIDRKGRDVTTIDFKYEVPNPEVFPGIPYSNAGSGGFTQRRDGDQTMFRSQHSLDGIWSRTGAGTIACPVYRSQTAALSFTTFWGAATAHPPPLNAGRGLADFVVFEKKLEPKEFTEKGCLRCLQVSKSCSYREPLSACSELGQCLQTAGVPLSACTSIYR